MSINIGWMSYIYRALGVQLNGHLPAEGMPERKIGGHQIWVKPKQKRMSLRVMVRCPVCKKELAAARFAQHNKTHFSADKKAASVGGYPF